MQSFDKIFGRLSGSAGPLESEGGNLLGKLLSFESIGQRGRGFGISQKDVVEAIAILSGFVFCKQGYGSLSSAAGIEVGEFFDGESFDVIGLAFAGELFESRDSFFPAEVSETFGCGLTLGPGGFGIAEGRDEELAGRINSPKAGEESCFWKVA